MGITCSQRTFFSWCHLWVLFSPNKKWICIIVALVTGNPCLEAWLGDPPMPWGKLIVLPANSGLTLWSGEAFEGTEERGGDNVQASCREGLMGLLPLKKQTKKGIRKMLLEQGVGSKGFPDSSVGKESACNAGDPSSFPGLWRSAGEGTGYPLQYPWASLVAPLVKNQPAMRETWVQSLG